MSASSAFLFLHIPKTAGTSFRLGAIQALGEDHCQFDYGRESPETSSLVRQHFYDHPDLYRLGRELDHSRCQLLGGHFPYAKYAPLFRVDRVLAFCRDPHRQLMSHYAHFVRHNDYQGTLSEFLVSSAGAGMQQRTFGRFPVSSFGFVGVTERYAESLRVIKMEYGLDVEPMFRNVNPVKPHEEDYQVPPEVRAEYDKAVNQDANVYRLANTLLDARLAAIDSGYKYVHGAASLIGNSAIRGYAFRSGDDDPVSVELMVNGRPERSGAAVEDRHALRAANAPRKGYVGFSFAAGDLLKPGDHYQIRVASTGQVLGSGAVDVPHEDNQL